MDLNLAMILVVVRRSTLRGLDPTKSSKVLVMKGSLIIKKRKKKSIINLSNF